MPRYFVMHLTDRDLKERGRPISEMRYEIQLLNSNGQAVNCGYVDGEQRSLEIEGEKIPYPVIEAASRQSPGKGAYVDANGKSVLPF